MISLVSRWPRRPLPAPLASRGLSTLGIRREDPARIWERRTPLTPSAIASLGPPVQAEVESCRRRCFPDEDYKRAGAEIVPHLSGNVDLVLGIKEPPLSEVQALLESGKTKPRTWMVFSHTHKGQEYNTGLLSAFLTPTKGQTLIDHELLTVPAQDGKLERAAAFGWYAGAVGAGEALSMTGLGLLRRGVATPPLLNLPRPYTFANLEEFRKGLRRTGDGISSNPLTEPTVIGITGRGNVAKGAQAMLDVLGVEWVTTDQLPTLRRSDRIYACMLGPESYFLLHDGRPYSRDEYYANPQEFESVFGDRIAPYLTTLINGAGWKPGFPRIMTNVDMSRLVDASGVPTKLVAVQDITCDIEGNLEFMNQHSTIDQPHYLGPGAVTLSAIDILPTELPRDASEHFSERLLPYIRQLAGDSRDPTLEESLDRATIVRSGTLTQPHTWLQSKVEAYRASFGSRDLSTRPRPEQRSVKKKVLLLGSGLVAGPAVEVFAARPDVHLIIASNNLSEARSLIGSHQEIGVISLDVSDREALEAAVKAADVIVSLLPAPMHPQVAEHCITHGKHLVTASYISPEMRVLHDRAVARDIILLNECGLDPGIDSMAAMRILDRIQRERKQVTSFISWCGGLPDPAASNVPFGYKFSWSPKAVLTAAKNPARFKLDDRVQEITGDDLLQQHFPNVPLWKGLALEGLANRDSMPYAEKYNLGPVEGLRDLFRGTLRYQGFSKLLESFRRLGLLSSEPFASPPQSWNAVLLQSLHAATGETGLRNHDVQSALIDLVEKDTLHETTDTLQWLSLLPGGTSTSVPFPNLTQAAPIDYLAAILSRRLSYEPKERDSVLLHHSFSLRGPQVSPNDQSNEVGKVTASLLCYGTPEASAMATTVGKTLAFATLRVLDGKVAGRGVRGPVDKDVWHPILESLEDVGVRIEERWS